MIPVNARSSIRADGVHSCDGMGNVLRCHLIAMRYVVEPGGASVAAGGKRFAEKRWWCWNVVGDKQKIYKLHDDHKTLDRLE